MSGWHSLAGYLIYRPGGALGLIKSRRRQWYVFEESKCQLLYYKSENEAGNRQPSGAIDIRGAAISLCVDDPNQFIINSHGKQHILEAETHESAMIWLLALQAKRDAGGNNLSSMIENGTAHNLEREERRRKESLPSDQEIQQMITRAMCAEDTTTAGLLMRSQSVRLSSSSSSCASASSYGCRRGSLCLNSKGAWPTSGCNLMKRQSIDLGSATADSSISEETGPEQEDWALDSMTSFSSSVPPGGRCRSMSLAVPKTPLSHRFSDCKLSKWSADDHSIRNGKCGESGQPFSAASSLATCSSVRNLEDELMTAKCELAKALNRESTLKGVIEERESAIGQLEGQLQHLQTSGANREDGICSTLSSRKLEEKCRILQNQNRFLNEEVLKLSRMWQQEQMKVMQQQQRSKELEFVVDRLKRDYVFLLQSSIRIYSNDGPEVMQVPVYGGASHRERIRELLDEARKVNPILPSLEGMARSGCHVDSYGFKHCYVNEGLMLHYLCCQLHLHYTGQLTGSERVQKKWRELLHRSPSRLPRSKEVKRLVRKGIPNHLRNKIWGLLVFEKVRDIQEAKGPLYYSSLCSMVAESEVVAFHQRQIQLDLLRTMPRNVHFSERDSDGIRKLQEVLQAFCLHNPVVGYCQGMNFIVGMALLFMGAEDAFWFLVAVTERFFPPHYFDQNLLGAQADQDVLRDLILQKLPSLMQHLANLDIELSTVTLNWFLAVFFESVPLETLLRIWDCFLYEGPKVLFRFSAAILKMHESALLERTDTVSTMKLLKSSGKLCYDTEGLVRTAFSDLKPFPRRSEIVSKQAYYLKTLKDKHRKRIVDTEILENAEKSFWDSAYFSEASVIDCAATAKDGNIWVCEGERSKCCVMQVSYAQNTMFRLNIEFDARILCCHSLGQGLVLFGSLSKRIYAFSTDTRELMWTVNLNSAVLGITSDKKEKDVQRVYAALADGTIAALEDVGIRENMAPQPIYIMVGSVPVTCILMVDKHLWCGCGNKIIILHALTLDTLDQFVVSSNVLDVVNHMVDGELGVWVSIRGSSICQLWDPRHLTCKTIFDVKDQRCPRACQDTSYTTSRITCMMPYGPCIWVGTGDGHILIYDVCVQPSPKASANNSPSSPRRGSFIDKDENVEEQLTAGMAVRFVMSRLPSAGIELMANADGCCDGSKQMRGRSDSGYQTVGDSGRDSLIWRAILNSNGLPDTNNTNAGSKTSSSISDEFVSTTDQSATIRGSTCVATNSATLSSRSSSHTDEDRASRVAIRDDADSDQQEDNMSRCGETVVTAAAATSSGEDVDSSYSSPNRYWGGFANRVSGTGQQDHFSCGKRKLLTWASRNRSRSRLNSKTTGRKTVTDAMLRSLQGLLSEEPCSRSLPSLDALQNRYSDTCNTVRRADSSRAIFSSPATVEDDVNRFAGRVSAEGFRSPSTTCDSYEFDDVFVMYADDDRDMVDLRRRRSIELAMSYGKPTKIGGSGQQQSFRLSKPKIPTIRLQKADSMSSSDNDGNWGSNIREKGKSIVSAWRSKTHLPNKIVSPSATSENADADSPCTNNEQTNRDKKSRDSDTASCISLSENEAPYKVFLRLQEQIKIAEKPVRCLVMVQENGESAIVSCAGGCEDPDSILIWRLQKSDAFDKQTWSRSRVTKMCPSRQSST